MPPFVVAYGQGVDSTAMLLGLHARGQRPDLILFADTGDEKPETYDYRAIIDGWLAEVGWPAVITVRRKPTRSRVTGNVYTTLGENCLEHKMLPSLAYGRKGCSLKFKREPQDAFVAAWEPARAAWKAGLRVVKAIGYDAGPKDARRSTLKDDKRYTYVYPLREWGWDRGRCVQEIEAAGLPVPEKSACFYCPASKPAELVTLHRKHPELTARIIEMEDRAKPGLTTIEGLWRRACKGTRGAVPHPGSMAEFLRGLS
jgi:hypothetical protein